MSRSEIRALVRHLDLCLLGAKAEAHEVLTIKTHRTEQAFWKEMNEARATLNELLELTAESANGQEHEASSGNGTNGGNPPRPVEDGVEGDAETHESPEDHPEVSEPSPQAPTPLANPFPR